MYLHPSSLSVSFDRVAKNRHTFAGPHTGLVRPARRRDFSVALRILASLLVLLAMAHPASSEQASIRDEMQDASAALQELFGYVWSEDRFTAKEADPEIRRLLERLSSDFHSVEKQAGDRVREPGFEIILNAQRETLADASKRFAQGKKTYARWRLRSVIENCVACHSRIEVPLELRVDANALKQDSYSDKFQAAELLFATRQFDAARSLYGEVAQNLARDTDGMLEAIDALHKWLMIEVRVQHQWDASANRLAEILKESRFSEREREVIQTWIADLRSLTELPAESSYADVLKEVHSLLEPVANEDSLLEQEKHVVTTLRASALLHGLSAEARSAAENREILYLLGLSYARLPFEQVDFYSRLYLERCIREHPKTEEAKKSFTLFEQLLTLAVSGSSGVHLEEEDKALLNTLAELAGTRVSSEKLRMDEESSVVSAQ